MFPAELKRAFGEVLKAKQEGQAALERARGESAALRNLANAARVLEGNPALSQLPTVLTRVRDGTYEEAACSIEEIDALIYSMQLSFGRAADMDW
jgi:hypothetical protein